MPACNSAFMSPSWHWRHPSWTYWENDWGLSFRKKACHPTSLKPFSFWDTDVTPKCSVRPGQKLLRERRRSTPVDSNRITRLLDRREDVRNRVVVAHVEYIRVYQNLKCFLGADVVFQLLPSSPRTGLLISACRSPSPYGNSRGWGARPTYKYGNCWMINSTSIHSETMTKMIFVTLIWICDKNAFTMRFLPFPTRHCGRWM